MITSQHKQNDVSTSTDGGFKRQRNSSDHLIAGTAAGIASTTALYPLDLIKTRYQAYDRVSSPYSSVGNAFKSIIRKDGWKSLYQGIGPAIFGSGISWGGYFYFYEIIKSVMKDHLLINGKLSSVHHLTAGLLAGNILVLLTNPIWLIKTRMQLQEGFDSLEPNRRPYRGLIDAFRTIVREEGPRALYRGSFAAALLSFQGALQFTAYEWLKENFKMSKEKNHPFQSLLMGGSSKIFASVVTYPYQVIKTRLQDRTKQECLVNDGKVIMKRKYTSTLQCVRMIIKNEGLKGFFRGSVPYALRAAPASAVTFVVYEEVIKLRLKMEYKN